MDRDPLQTMRSSELGKPGFSKAYGFGLVTGVLFLGAWLGQFITQLMVVRNEAEQHGAPFSVRELAIGVPAIGVAGRRTWGCCSSGVPRSPGRRTNASRPSSTCSCTSRASTRTPSRVRSKRRSDEGEPRGGV